MNVSFIDTSILIYILDIDDENHPLDLVKKKSIQEEYNNLYDHRSEEMIIVPISTLVETGNYIARIPSSKKLYEVGKAFNELISELLYGKPWCIYSFTNDDIELYDPFGSCNNSDSKIEPIVYLYEKFKQRYRNQINNIRIWSTDEHLQQYHEENIQPIRRNKM